VPVQAAAAHPSQSTQRDPSGHSVSAVHQQGTPAALQLPVGDETSLQLPAEQDQVSATDVAVSQSSLSAVPVPVHVPVHCVSLFTHLPLAQS
jgi:hypothetical protein